MEHKEFERFKNDYTSKYELICELSDKAKQSVQPIADILNTTIANIIVAPTVTIKAAHWVDKTDWLGTLAIYKYACSNCGFTIGHKPFSRADGKGDKYCEECGCKMTVEENK